MFIILALLGAASAARPVDRYSASWSTPGAFPTGRPTPPDGLYTGNGDVTLMLTGNTSASAPAADAPLSPMTQPASPATPPSDAGLPPPMQTPPDHAAPVGSGNGMNPTGPAGMQPPAQPQP